MKIKDIETYFDGKLFVGEAVSGTALFFYDNTVSFLVERLSDINIIEEWSRGSKDVTLKRIQYSGDEAGTYIIMTYEYRDEQDERLAQIKRMERIIKGTKTKDGNIGTGNFIVPAKALLESAGSVLAYMKRKYFDDFGVSPDDIN